MLTCCQAEDVDCLPAGNVVQMGPQCQATHGISCDALIIDSGFWCELSASGGLEKLFISLSCIKSRFSCVCCSHFIALPQNMRAPQNHHCTTTTLSDSPISTNLSPAKAINNELRRNANPSLPVISEVVAFMFAGMLSQCDCLLSHTPPQNKRASEFRRTKTCLSSSPRLLCGLEQGGARTPQ